MSRLSALVRRDVPGWILLALGIVCVAMLAEQPSASMDTGGVSADATPFLLLFAKLQSWLPDLRTPESAIPLVSLALAWLAALGLFYCVWRLTRNRVVSLGAAFLGLAHPLMIAALFEAAGIRDLLFAAFVAWSFALNAKPRFRSSRFPNLPPAAATKPLIALMALGLLTAPGYWICPLLLFAMDIPFHREVGRGALDRNWRSYLPHVACIALGLVLQLVWGLSPEDAGFAESVQGFSSTLGSIFFAGVDHNLVVAWSTLLVVVFCVGVGVLEALFDMGKRRLTLPYFGLAGFVATAALLFGVLDQDARYGASAWPAFLGFAVLLPVLAWRVMMKFTPPTAEQTIEVPHRPSWDEVLGHANLVPLPDLQGLPPAPRLEEWTNPVVEVPQIEAEQPTRNDLDAALERLGMSLELKPKGEGAWDKDFASRELEPLLMPSSSVFAFLPSRSPYASFAAALCADMTIVERGDQGFAGVSAFDHVKLFEYDGRRPWPAASASADVVMSVGCLSRLRTPQLKEALEEFERILKVGGQALLVFRHLDTLDEGESNPLPPDMASSFCRDAGLTVESVAEALNGSYRILAKREAQ